VPTGTGAPFSLATLVPLVLILMTITGSVYPAIDLTAGERERGTLEMLIAAPVSRVELLIAKYIAVLTVAVLTAMINLLAMTTTLLTSALGSQLFPEGISATLLMQILGLMILFATFFSAIVLALTSCARSFKEAQAYLIPVMLLAISPGLLSLMPGLQLSGMLALAPLINIVLLARDILEGTAVPAMAFVAIVTTVVYAAIAIAVASKIFGNDALLYASRGSWSELFQRPRTRLASPPPAATIACLATLFPIYFILGNLAQRAERPLETQLAINALITVAVFGLWPLLFAVAQRVSLRSGFRLHPAPWLALAGALVLGVTLWPYAYELFLLGRWAGLVSLDMNQFTAMRRVLEQFEGMSPALLLAALAVVPAVMEELFFRGYLFQGLSNRIQGPGIVVVTALLFGLFHVLSPSTLMPERFLPSTMLGLFLGWVCYQSNSVLPGMLLHSCHNGLLLLMVRYRDALVAQGWNPHQSEHVPLSWLAVSAALAAVGAVAVYGASRRQRAAKCG
jgi:ABC-2 type transport system permease protein/sodium transport system permease protein